MYTLTFVSLLGYTGLSVGVHALPTDSLPGHSHPRAKDLLLPAPRIRLEDDTHSNEFAGNIFSTQGYILCISIISFFCNFLHLSFPLLNISRLNLHFKFFPQRPCFYFCDTKLGYLREYI